MKMKKQVGCRQFFIPATVVKEFLKTRDEKQINDLDLNILVDANIVSGNYCIRIVNGDFEGNNFAIMTGDEI